MESVFEQRFVGADEVTASHILYKQYLKRYNYDSVSCPKMAFYVLMQRCFWGLRGNVDRPGERKDFGYYLKLNPEYIEPKINKS